MCTIFSTPLPQLGDEIKPRSRFILFFGVPKTTTWLVHQSPVQVPRRQCGRKLGSQKAHQKSSPQQQARNIYALEFIGNEASFDDEVAVEAPSVDHGHRREQISCVELVTQREGFQTIGIKKCCPQAQTACSVHAPAHTSMFPAVGDPLDLSLCRRHLQVHPSRTKSK